jgi:transcription elongation GreA/GreB family factor
VESNKALTYTVLGAWDSDVKAGIISYQTVMAQALLNHKVNDVLEIRTEDGSNRKVRVEKIEPHGIDLSVPN